MSALRARIVAVVSSQEQATEEHASLDEQIRLSREAIVRGGWIEAEPPMRTVTSRDFIHLAELRAVAPDFDALCAQVEHGEIDLIVGRDHSRVFGRTENLQMEFRTFLQLNRCQWYFYMRPELPVARSMLGRRGAKQTGGDYASAVAAVADAEEVRRLVERREQGMNKHAAEGRWRLSRTPYGYTRPVIGTRGASQIFGEMVIDEAAARNVREAYELYLTGENTITLARALGEWTGRPWRNVTVSQLLANPAYVAVLVWGAGRADVVMRGGVVRHVLRQVADQWRCAELAEAALSGIDARTPEEREAGLVVARGNWPAIVEARTWLAVQERRRRRTGDRRDFRNRHLLSGIAVCDRCGGPYNVVAHYYGRQRINGRIDASRRVPIYGCRRHVLDTSHCAPNYARADQLHAELFAELRKMVATDRLIREGLSVGQGERPVDRVAPLQAELAQAERALRQWDAAYESGSITLAEFQAKRQPHRRNIARIQREVAKLASTRLTVVPIRERIAALRKAAGRFEQLAADNPRLLREQLVQLIAELRVRDKHITLIRLRLDA